MGERQATVIRDLIFMAKVLTEVAIRYGANVERDIEQVIAVKAARALLEGRP